MVKKHSIVKKSRLITIIVAMLFSFAALAIVMLLSQQRAITIGHAVIEAEDDDEFLSGLIKEAYLKKDYT